MSSYGINTQSSLMFPCAKELGQTLALCHAGGGVERELSFGIDSYNYGIAR